LDQVEAEASKMATPAPQTANFMATHQQQSEPLDLSKKKSEEPVQSMDLDNEPNHYDDGTTIGPYGSCYPPEWSYHHPDFLRTPSPSQQQQQSSVSTQTSPLLPQPATVTRHQPERDVFRRSEHHPYAGREERNHISGSSVAAPFETPTELRGHDLSSDTASAFMQYRPVSNNTWPPRGRSTSPRRIPPATITGKYLNFFRELSNDNDNHRLLFVREFNGKVYIGIRNSAPFSPYKLTFQQDVKNLKQEGVFLNRQAWNALCRPETAAFVECATSLCINRSMLYCAQWPDYSGYNTDAARDSFNTENESYEYNLAGNKWLDVRMSQEEPCIVFSEKYFSAKQNRVITSKSIFAPMHVWEEIRRCMGDVAIFLDQIDPIVPITVE
jgi:hypothetical protein